MKPREWRIAETRVKCEAGPKCVLENEDCSAGLTARQEWMPELEVTLEEPHDALHIRQVARGFEPQAIRITRAQFEELVRVVKWPDTPESVAEKARGARSALEAANAAFDPTRKR